MPFHPASDALPRHRRWRALLLALGLVLLAHTLTLGLLPIGVADGWRGGVKRSLQVRQIRLAPPAAPPQAAAAPKPKTPRAAAMAPAAAPAAPVPAPAAEAGEPPAEAETPAAELAPAAEPEAGPLPGADNGGAALPVYATRPPPPALLRYELRRGALRGSAELRWLPDGERYELALQGTAFSVPLIAWSSLGAFDGAGIAPERFVDRRRGRGAQAVNFERAAGRITFSGPAAEYPLLPGAQDRLSWMLQLPAVVEADQAKLWPGARISMFVAGARGDGDVWTFEVEAVEAIELPAGRVEAALRLRREPRKPYDTRVEVWLDPARWHLPVRVRLSAAPAGEGTEFLLSGLQPP